MDPQTLAALRTPEGRRLLDEVAGHRIEQELSLATRLRRTHPAGLVAAALGQARLRGRARVKFGDDAARMFFTADGVEQATRTTVAELRATRLAAAGARRLVDLCCGVGGDALAMARAGIAVTAVDRDPLTCAVVEANAAALGLGERIEVRCADVADVDLDGYDAAFLDPARRTSRGRVFDPRAYSPPLSFLDSLADRVPLGAAKTAPGIPHALVPEGMEAQWVSDGGEVKEAVLWWGAAARTSRRATLLPGGHALTGGPERAAPSGPVRAWLYEPDGAVVRAHLVAEVADLVDGTLVDPSIAYLTSDRLVHTPFARAWQITDVLPFNLKRLRALVRQRGIGHLTVKKRGSALDPEQVRARVRPQGSEAATVVLTRVAGAPTMLFAQPAPEPSGRPGDVGG